MYNNNINTLLIHENRYFQPTLLQHTWHKTCQQTWECFNYEGIYRVQLGDDGKLKYLSKSLSMSIAHNND